MQILQEAHSAQRDKVTIYKSSLNKFEWIREACSSNRLEQWTPNPRDGGSNPARPAKFAEGEFDPEGA